MTHRELATSSKAFEFQGLLPGSRQTESYAAWQLESKLERGNFYGYRFFRQVDYFRFAENRRQESWSANRELAARTYQAKSLSI